MTPGPVTLSLLPVVRYASPAFWTREDFDRHDKQKQILRHSAFASPSKIGKHRQWFYSESADKMVFNPNPEESPAETWVGLLPLFRENQVGETLRAHVRAVAEALGTTETIADIQNENRWTSRLQNYGRFERDDIAFLTDLRTVALEAELGGADWVVLVEPRGWMLDLDWYFDQWPFWR